MKKIELNLTTAFTLRKRINEIAHRLQRELTCVRYMVDAESKQDQLELLTYKDVEKQLDVMDKYYIAVENLSNKIDEVNGVGKSIMNRLQRINTEIQVATIISNGLNTKQTQKTRNPVTGIWEVEKYVGVTDYDITTHTNKLKQAKVRAEDELANINASTKFDFELDEEIYNTIYGE